MENTPNQPAEFKAPEQKTDIKKWAIIAAIVIIALFFLKTLFSPENIAERMIEQASNGEYDVDVKGDGSMQITDTKGEGMNIVTGKNATLPDNWPNTVPTLPDANIEYSAVVSNGEDGTSFTVTYSTKQAIKSVMDFYTEGLTTNGWTIEATVNTSDGSMLSASNENDDAVVINVGESEQGTMVVISAQTSK